MYYFLYLFKDGQKLWTECFIFWSNYPVKVHYGSTIHHCMSCNHLTIRLEVIPWFLFCHIAQLVLRFFKKSFTLKNSFFCEKDILSQFNSHINYRYNQTILPILPTIKLSSIGPMYLLYSVPWVMSVAWPQNMCVFNLRRKKPAVQFNLIHIFYMSFDQM